MPPSAAPGLPENDHKRAEPAPRPGPILAGGPARPRASIEGPTEVQGRPSGPTAHRAEYRSPAIWFFRRLVGLSAAFAVVVTAWWLVKLPSGLVADRALPAPAQVRAAMAELDADGFAGADLWGHTTISLVRLGSGLGIGLILGGLLGVVMALGSRARSMLDPIVSAMRMTPPVVMIPLFLIWFGLGEAAIVAVVAHGVVWPVADVVGTVRLRRVRHLAVDPVHEAVGSARSVLLLAWTGVLVVEVVVASEGVGWLVWSAQDRSDMLFVGLLLAATVGVVLDVVIRVVHYSFGRTGSDDARTTVDLGPVPLGDLVAQRGMKDSTNRPSEEPSRNWRLDPLP